MSSNGRCPSVQPAQQTMQQKLDVRAVFDKVLNHEDCFDMKTDLVRSDKVSGCKWSLGADPATSPHTQWQLPPREGPILPSILNYIGETPLVRLNNIPKSYGIRCEVVAKCEFLNPGGSVKDRIALRMVEDAEKAGLLKPGGVIVEATSGNTGVGLAMVAAAKGYHCVIVIPDRMSLDKIQTLKALGAEVIRTDSTLPYDAFDGMIAVAQRVCKEIPNSFLTNQYRNPANPLAHYETTGQEIVDSCGGKIDMLVLGSGTGGTMTGITRKIKELCPDVQIVGADPMGSTLACPAENNRPQDGIQIEGIGYAYVPTTCDRSLVDKWVKVSDKDSYLMARRLIREEGLLCGGSSGCIMTAAMKAAVNLQQGQRCVIIIPDSIRNYLTNFTSDDWMESRGHIVPPLTKCSWWSLKNVSALGLKPPSSVHPLVTCRVAFNEMKRESSEHLSIIDDLGILHGMVSVKSIISQMAKGLVTPLDAVEKAKIRLFRKIPSNLPLIQVTKLFEFEEFLTVVQKQCVDGSVEDKEIIVGIVTPADLLTFITSEEEGKQ